MKIIAKSFVFAAALVVALAGGSVRGAVETGKPAPDFTLTDIGGKVHRLSDYRGKTVVLEWVNPECPIVRKHYESGNLPRTQKAAVADGVVWLAINSGRAGAQGDLNNIRVLAWQKDVGAGMTAYLRDADAKIGRLYGAKATPHMYVITADGTLAYQGAIDSIPSGNVADIARAKNYVTSALAAVKAGKPVEPSSTRAYGCAVKY